MKLMCRSLLTVCLIFMALGAERTVLADDMPGFETAGNPEMTAKDVLNHVIYLQPRIENGKIILPASPDPDYRIVIGGSSNEAVISSGGIVYTPLENMEVRLLYKVESLNNSDDCAMSSGHDVSVTVPGRYSADEKDNPRPAVLPGIMEWKGLSGKFVLKKGSSIIIEDESLDEMAGVIREYLCHFCGFPLGIKTAIRPGKGDLYFSLSENCPELGREGYHIEIGDVVKVTAPTKKGCLYAGTTLAQMLASDAGHDNLPKGIVGDYPAYEIRGCMLDVARFYIPLDYVKEMVRYMAWFKINEVQMHINDDGGEQSAGFRVESRRFPAINSGLNPSEVYSQEDYRQFQQEMAKYGVDIITEIDTPAHCRFVALHNPSYMLDDSHIDLKNRDAIGFIKSLYDEFLDGDNPVFISRNFHIGADEYHRDPVHGEDFMLYLNEMIAHVESKGLNPRMWASIGGGGLNGTTPVRNTAVANYWAYSWADF